MCVFENPNKAVKRKHKMFSYIDNIHVRSKWSAGQSDFQNRCSKWVPPEAIGTIFRIILFHFFLIS